jgi:iron complex transport system ATP-binding protein
MRLLRDFAAGGGAVVTVLHALELAVAYAGRMVVLAEGAVVADGAPGVVGPQAAAVFGMAWRDGHVPLLACLKS